MFDENEEISPEELFKQFFGGGAGGFPGFGMENYYATNDKVDS